MGRFLTELDDVARTTGYPVQLVNGWERNTRSGSPDGYASGRPTHIMVHHTASPPSSDGWNDATYIAHGASTKPISNLYISRNGTIYVCAAGPTNTNGSGSCSSSDGSASWQCNVPDDSMNSYAIGIECANDGTGEPWDSRLIDSLLKLVKALQSAFGIDSYYVRAHHEWTSRKIDPAGPSPYAKGTAKWNMDAFRADLSTTNPPEPTPDPTPSEDETMFAIRDNQGRVWVGNGVHRRHVPNPDQWGHLIWASVIGNRPILDAVTGKQITERTQVSDGEPERVAALGVIVVE